ncbi:MAG: 4Fe-4S binding protein [Candidatus Cloacimonetes bacterium]|nr:4Fe-4S binding protein [Candidatus Cloacimonadota bacterium]
MALIITSECVKCCVCQDICPTSAIVESEEQFIITDACVECGKCLEACPIEAITNVKINGQ